MSFQEQVREFPYCVYVTFYNGDKLPPFYIGSTSVKKIMEEGYRGSVTSKKYSEVWKSELKTNPQLFDTKIVGMFRTRGEAHDEELRQQLRADVVQSDDYTNMALACKGFFHSSKHTEESKAKMSESHKKWIKSEKGQEWLLSGKYTWQVGHIPWNKGMRNHLSAEVVESISSSLKEYYSNNPSPCIGRIKSKDEIENISKGIRSMTPEARSSQKESQRISQKETWKNKTVEEDQERRDKISTTASGKVGVRRPCGKKTRCRRDELDKNLSIGWKLGWVDELARDKEKRLKNEKEQK